MQSEREKGESSRVFGIAMKTFENGMRRMKHSHTHTPNISILSASNPMLYICIIFFLRDICRITWIHEPAEPNRVSVLCVCFYSMFKHTNWKTKTVKCKTCKRWNKSYSLSTNKHSWKSRTTTLWVYILCIANFQVRITSASKVIFSPHTGWIHYKSTKIARKVSSRTNSILSVDFENIFTYKEIRLSTYKK